MCNVPREFCKCKAHNLAREIRHTQFAIYFHSFRRYSFIIISTLYCIYRLYMYDHVYNMYNVYMYVSTVN